MTVSLVGRMAMGSASSDWPERVTQATSGAKSAMWSFSCSLRQPSRTLETIAWAEDKVEDLFESLLRHEEREVAVADAQSLDLLVEEVVDRLPDVVGPRPQDVAAADVVVLDHFRLGDHLLFVK